MRVRLASWSGHGRPNEDFVGAVPGAVVLLDGAGIPGAESVCRHGVAWYAHTLGGTVLGILSREPGTELAVALGESISHVAGLHRDTCDLASPISPQTTVAMVRFDGDRVDHLVLADAFVVLDSSRADPVVVTDSREVDVREECLASMRGLPAGSPAYERALPSAVSAIRARRNQPGGYWVAKDDPHAASEAVTGSASLEQVRGAAVLSNGASRIVDPYRLAGWPEVVDVLRTKGPDEILRRVRAAEAEALATGAPSDAYSPDDASVAWWEAAAESGSANAT